MENTVISTNLVKIKKIPFNSLISMKLKHNVLIYILNESVIIEKVFVRTKKFFSGSSKKWNKADSLSFVLDSIANIISYFLFLGWKKEVAT